MSNNFPFLQPEYPARFRGWPLPQGYTPSEPVPIRILEQDLSIVAEIEDYEHLTFIRRWHRPGEFELHINRHKLYADELTRGRLIMVGGDTSRCGIIRHREIKLDRAGKLSETWRIRGYSLASITEQRITVPPDLDYDVVDDNAETVMKEYIENNVTAPQNDPFGERAIDVVSLAINQNRGPRVRWQTRYKNLTSELEGISLYSGLGWDIRPNFDLEKWVFDVYSGVDRSASQSDRAPVVFSVAYDTIEQMAYVDSDIDYKNLAYVAGQGEGAEREIARVAGGVLEAVRIEATDDQWNAGELLRVEPEDGDLILETTIPAGTDITFTETLDADWEDYALMDGLAAQDDNLISVREPVVAGSQTYTTVGSGSWTVPDGVYEIDLLIVGGGGGGGRTQTSSVNGSGGAGGVVYRESMAVTPGESHNYVIGDGGTSAKGKGNNGGNSSFGSLVGIGGGGGWGGYDPYVGGTGSAGGSGGGGGAEGDNGVGAGGAAQQPSSASGGFGSSGGSGSYSYGGGGGGAGGSGNSSGYGGAGIVVKGTTYAQGGGRSTSSVANSGNGTRTGSKGDAGVVKIWWDDQTGTGNRITKPINLNSIVTAKDSEITINKEEPDGYDGEAKVYALVNSSNLSTPSVDSVAWEEQTSGNALTVITPDEDYRGKFLWLKQVITIAVVNDPTPYIEDYTVTIEDVGIRYYEEDGQRTSPPLALEGVVKASQSAIAWQETLPDGTDITIETAVNADAETEPVGDYEEATNGEAIPSILENDSMLGKYLWVRQSLDANAEQDETPRLSSLSVSVLGSDATNLIGLVVFNPNNWINTVHIDEITVDMQIMFEKDHPQPPEITNGAWYYVVGIDGNAFQVSATEGGAPITFDGDADYSGQAYKKIESLPVGINRYELFVDARDLSEEDFLPARGKRKLADHTQTRFLEAQVLTGCMYQYRTHFNLGDMVTVKNDDWGVTLDAKITEAQEVWETSGYLVRVVFDNKVPDILDRIKGIMSNAEHELRR